MDNSEPGKKKVTTGSKAAEQYVSQDCLSKCMYLSLAQMYILMCICLFHTGFNLCQACAIISRSLSFHHANLEKTFMLLRFIVVVLFSFLIFRMQFPMRFLRGSGVHGAKLFFQDLGFYFNLSLYKTTIQAYLYFLRGHVSGKGKPSAKASEDSDPQRAGKGTQEVKSADFRSSPSKLLSEHEFENDGDDVIGNKDAAKQVETGHLSS
jgi:hypothetical protein